MVVYLVMEDMFIFSLFMKAIFLEKYSREHICTFHAGRGAAKTWNYVIVRSLLCVNIDEG